MNPVLRMKDLRVNLKDKNGLLNAVNGVDLDIYPGEIVALVGESGCGKSLTALSILKLLPPGFKISCDKILYKDLLLSDFTEKQMRSIRGREIGLILQDPASALNPVLRVGFQLSEVLTTHFPLTKKEAKLKALEWMAKVRLANPEQLYDAWPHQLSGGMKQRLLIAIALACQPSLLIADEPTTALDVSIQQQILRLLRELVRQHNISLLMISHDLGVVAEMADRVAVMYAGRIIESSPVRDLFAKPLHPYTRGLLQAIPGFSLLSGKQLPLEPLQGAVPSPYSLPSGCAFHPRCPHAFEQCRQERPENTAVSDRSSVACFYVRQLIKNDQLSELHLQSSLFPKK